MVAAGGLSEVAVPFVNVDRDGVLDLDTVDERAALRCALSRICAYCSLPQGFPLVFLGEARELAAGLFDRPGMHETCAEAALAPYSTTATNSTAPARDRVLLATGSFTVQRPDRRGDGGRVRFKPGPVIWQRPD